MIFNLVFILKKDKIILDLSKWGKKEIFIICISLCVLLIGALLLIPENMINESGSITNSIAHLIGFIIGFWTYFIWDVKESK
tara:strand:- start:892 stop:1137 length:246 start_codon:yes stop_codon:yes gene_type:complete